MNNFDTPQNATENEYVMVKCIFAAEHVGPTDITASATMIQTENSQQAYCRAGKSTADLAAHGSTS